jgi:signal transduction histidine kinase
MVELHQGRIWATSEGEGRGATIHLALPIGEPDEGLEEAVLCGDGGETLALEDSLRGLAGEAEDLAPGAGDARPLPDMSLSLARWADREADHAGSHEQPAQAMISAENRGEVLIAEDNPDMRALLAMLLGREFHVRTARNGREALDAVQQSAPDLVLSDVMMPEVSGLELCRILKADPATRGIPVLLVTSRAEREMKIEGLELGADDYVTKPFHPRELLARARSLVRSTSLQRELAKQNKQLERALAELKQAEVQLVQSERLAAVGELAAGLAHEVHNPVNFALNAARAMEVTAGDLARFVDEMMETDTSDPAEWARRLEACKREAGGQHARELSEALLELSGIVGEGLKRTSALVGDLHDFARPGRQGEFSSGVDVEAGLRSTLTLVSHAISAADARLEIEVEPGLPRIEADPGGLNQVFLNLLKNAVEAMGGRGGLIRIALSLESERLVIRIRDDGPGIPAEALPRLFEPFYTTRGREGGSGLGLSISQQIIAAHGGTLEVESEEGAGAEFTIRLPIEKDPA